MELRGGRVPRVKHVTQMADVKQVQKIVFNTK